MSLAVGNSAPDFTLKTQTANGFEEITLSNNFGNSSTVLLFFPFAFSSICTEEMCSMNASLARFESLNAKVYGISIDSPYALGAMAQKDGITFPLLSDFNKTTSEAYDVLFEELGGFKGVSKRAAFVIDKAGKIVFSSCSDDPRVVPDFDAIKQALQ